MWDTSGAKYKHMLYNVSRARRKSWDKLKKAIEWYILVLKKERLLWTTKWVINTKKCAEARLKKMGISKDQVVKTLEKKGLNDLLSKIN
jgi:hypothetical protein